MGFISRYRFYALRAPLRFGSRISWLFGPVRSYWSGLPFDRNRPVAILIRKRLRLHWRLGRIPRSLGSGIGWLLRPVRSYWNGLPFDRNRPVAILIRNRLRLHWRLGRIPRSLGSRIGWLLRPIRTRGSRLRLYRRLMPGLVRKRLRTPRLFRRVARCFRSRIGWHRPRLLAFELRLLRSACRRARHLARGTMAFRRGRTNFGRRLIRTRAWAGCAALWGHRKTLLPSRTRNSHAGPHSGILFSAGTRARWSATIFNAQGTSRVVRRIWGRGRYGAMRASREHRRFRRRCSAYGS
jgi:hypothetical protein